MANTIVVPRRNATAGPGLSFVGAGAASNNNDAAPTTHTIPTLVGGSSGTLSQGDFLMVYSLIQSKVADTDETFSMSTSGFTKLVQSTTIGTKYGHYAAIWYKVMGATPDTNVTIDLTNDGWHTDDSAVVFAAFQGVHASTPFDGVTPVSQGGRQIDGAPNPGAITPNTTGAWIVNFAGATNATTSNDFASNSDYNEVVDSWNGAGQSADIAIGIKSNWVSGAFDAGAWTGFPTATYGNCQINISVVLKPA